VPECEQKVKMPKKTEIHQSSPAIKIRIFDPNDLHRHKLETTKGASIHLGGNTQPLKYQ